MNYTRTINISEQQRTSANASTRVDVRWQWPPRFVMASSRSFRLTLEAGQHRGRWGQSPLPFLAANAYYSLIDHLNFGLRLFGFRDLFARGQTRPRRDN